MVTGECPHGLLLQGADAQCYSSEEGGTGLASRNSLQRQHQLDQRLELLAVPWVVHHYTLGRVTRFELFEALSEGLRYY